MISKIKQLGLVYSGMALLCLSAIAEAQPRLIAGFQWQPEVRAAIGFDDNLSRRQASDDAAFYLIAPSIKALRSFGKHDFDVGYGLDIYQFDGSDEDDHVNQTLAANWKFRASSRHNFGLSAGWEEKSDSRGEGIRESLPGASPLDRDEYHETHWEAFWHMGSPGAKGRFEFAAGQSDKEYQNNREFTRVGDLDSEILKGAFLWRLSGKTRAVLEAEWAEEDFKFTNRDNDFTWIGVGLNWAATAKTEGRFRIRQIEKDFNDPLLQDQDGIGWTAAVRYSPRSYSTFEFATGREYENAVCGSTTVEREEYSLTWSHRWRERFGTSFGVSFINDEFIPSNRTDDITTFSAALRYQFRRYLSFDASLRYFDSSSSFAEFDYDRTLFQIGMTYAP